MHIYNADGFLEEEEGGGDCESKTKAQRDSTQEGMWRRGIGKRERKRKRIKETQVSRVRVISRDTERRAEQQVYMKKALRPSAERGISSPSD